jgi:TonB family protein
MAKQTPARQSPVEFLKESEREVTANSFLTETVLISAPRLSADQSGAHREEIRQLRRMTHRIFLCYVASVKEKDGPIAAKSGCRERNALSEVRNSMSSTSLSVVDKLALLGRNSGTEAVFCRSSLCIVMAHRPSVRADSAKPIRSGPATPEASAESVSPAAHSSDLAELAAKVAAHSRGKIPAELSSELALEILLNQIVEQACLATGAAGAAIALKRGEEMVCRATTGGCAPELGTRLDTNSGLSGACVRTGLIQGCNDAWSDPRADAELSRLLGVRSLVVYPLLRGEEILGVLEILSPIPSAFGERDLQTLQALASLTVKNVEAKQTALASGLLAHQAPVANTAVEKSAAAGSSLQTPSSTEKVIPAEENSITVQTPPLFSSVLLGEKASRANQRTGSEWLTAVIAIVLLGIAVMMGVVVAMRSGLVRPDGPKDAHPSPNSVAPVAKSVVEPTAAAATIAPIPAPTPTLPAKRTQTATASSVDGKTGGGNRGSAPDGGLVVYDQSKEIYRMSPAGVVQVTPELAEADLLKRVEPEYPAQALAQRTQGAVRLQVRIAQDGAVREVKVVNGEPVLADAAISAVKQWRFKPQTVHGKAVEMQTEITLKFSLPAH